MTFLASAQDVRIEDDHVLKGQLQNVEGEWEDAEIDLDQFIANDNGRLAWDGENFSGSAEEVSFSIEGDGDVPVLRAVLHSEDGAQQSDLNLAERLENHNGSFVFV